MPLKNPDEYKEYMKKYMREKRRKQRERRKNLKLAQKQVREHVFAFLDHVGALENLKKKYVSQGEWFETDIPGHVHMNIEIWILLHEWLYPEFKKLFWKTAKENWNIFVDLCENHYEYMRLYNSEQYSPPCSACHLAWGIAFMVEQRIKAGGGSPEDKLYAEKYTFLAAWIRSLEVYRDLGYDICKKEEEALFTKVCELFRNLKKETKNNE